MTDKLNLEYHERQTHFAEMVDDEYRYTRLQLLDHLLYELGFVIVECSHYGGGSSFRLERKPVAPNAALESALKGPAT